MSVLNDDRFHDEKTAWAWVESRLWPNGPVCPHCGETSRIGTLKGGSTRYGVRKCYACRKPFTVKVGTIFESSHVPMNLWLQAIYLMTSSKKGISTNQLHRTLGVTIRTAWFMSHRIREAMRDTSTNPLGGIGRIIEADETFYGKKNHPQPSPQRKGRPYLKQGKAAAKRPIMALVERGGDIRSFHVKSATQETIGAILTRHADPDSRLFTDQSRLYYDIGETFDSHDTIKHASREYVRGEVHINTIEGYFSVFKRGMRGIYQHCDEKHLHRYLSEFDFRYNRRAALGIDDVTRAELALQSVVGKRLKYRETKQDRGETA